MIPFILQIFVIPSTLLPYQVAKTIFTYILIIMKRKLGFTLVELLVVIAILAILGTVSIVGYTSFTKKAKERKAIDELTQLKTILISEDPINDDYDILTDSIKFNNEYAPIDESLIDETASILSDAYYIKDGVYTDVVQNYSKGNGITYYLKQDTSDCFYSVLKTFNYEDISLFGTRTLDSSSNYNYDWKVGYVSKTDDSDAYIYYKCDNGINTRWIIKDDTIEVFEINDSKDDNKTITTIDEYKIAAAKETIELAKLLLKDSDTDLEKYSALMPYSSVEEFIEIKEFTLELTKNCTTEKEKCIEIYKWITSNIVSDEVGAGYTTYEAFTKKKGLCSQFTQVMHDMLSSVGIVSFYISGYRGSYQKTIYSQVWGEPDTYVDWTFEEIVNRRDVGKYPSNHAWIIAKVDNEWSYYDAMAVWQNVNPWFAMSPETLIKNYKIPEELERIRIIPKTIELNLIDTSANGYIIYQGGDMFGLYLNNKSYGVGDAKTEVNGGLIFHRATDPGRVYYLMGDNDLIFEASSICDLPKYYNLSYDATLSRISMQGLDKNFFFYNSTGLRIPIVKGFEYLLLGFTDTELNEVLKDTRFRVHYDGLYLIFDNIECKIADLYTWRTS